MKPSTTSKPFPRTAEEVSSVIEAAPERIHDPESAYNPADPKAVEAFWKGSSVRRPAQRGECTKVEIEKCGDEVVLRPKPKSQFKTLADVARVMHESSPEGRNFPDREQPMSPEIRELDLEHD